MLEREAFRSDRLVKLEAVEQESKNREKVVIKLVALERAKVEEMRKQNQMERQFSLEKESQADELKLKLENSPVPTRQSQRKLEEQAEIISKQLEIISEKERIISDLKKQVDLLKSTVQKPLSALEKQKNSVLAELIKTEEAYLEDLMVLNSVILKPMFSSDDFSFGDAESIENMIEISRVLILRLKSPVKFKAVILSDFVVLAITPYSHFASKTFGEISRVMLRNSKQFAAFRRKVEADHRLKGLPLESSLIKPIQRICRYPLLLVELRKCVENNEIEELDTLNTVIAKFNEAVLTINEIRRESEMMNIALSVARLQISGLEDFEFWGSERRLLREEKDLRIARNGEKSQISHCWMFTDSLILVSPNKSKASIGISLISPRKSDAAKISPRKDRGNNTASSSSSFRNSGVLPSILKSRPDLVALLYFDKEEMNVKKSDDWSFEIESGRNSSYKLTFTKQDVKNEWFQAIDQLINLSRKKDIHRKRSGQVPNASPRDNQSGGNSVKKTPMRQGSVSTSSPPPLKPPTSHSSAPDFLDFLDSTGDKDEILEYLNYNPEEEK